MATEAKPYRLKSADLEDGIAYEIARERITVQIAERVAEMVSRGKGNYPTETDIAELRVLVDKRKNVGSASE